MNTRFVLLLLIASLSSLAKHPRDGLVAHWTFDEGSGNVAQDASSAKLHGKIHGADWTKGKHGHALRFDGNDSVEVPNHPALEITGDITVAAWVFKEKPNEAKRWDALVSKSPGKWDYEVLTSKSQSDQVAFFSPKAAPREVYSGKPVASGKWCHIAVTRSVNQVRMYLDGALVNTISMSGEFTKNGGALQIGLDGAKQVNGMIGIIDEVFLYNRALTEREIRQLM